MTAYSVHVHVEERYAGRVKPAVLRAAARAALAHQAAPAPAELTIVVSGDAYLRCLNRQYLGHDAPTDVLSFPSETFQPPAKSTRKPSAKETHLLIRNSQFAAPNSAPHYLGDIALSLARARAQAAAAGHPLEAELRLLVVHGVLHLLGYDHARPADKARMWAAQEEILSRAQKKTKRN